MLVGYPPFYDKKPIGIYKKILKGVIEFPFFLSNQSKDLIWKLLNPDFKYRLGYKRDGEDVMKHVFFDGVSFEDLFNLQIDAPWVPNIKNHSDTKFFDSYREISEPENEEIDQNLFIDF